MKYKRFWIIFGISVTLMLVFVAVLILLPEPAVPLSGVMERA